MASSKDKHLKKVKRSHTWIWLIIFVILILISSLLFGLFLSAYGGSLIADKYRIGRSAAQSMAEVYETCEREGIDSSVMLGGFGRQYLITDKAHNILQSEGENTCVFDDITGDERFSFVKIMIPLSGTALYPDTESREIFSIPESDTAEFDIMKMFARMHDYTTGSEDLLGYSDEDENYNWDERMLRIPFWIGISIDGGERELIVRTDISLEIYDIGNLLLLMLSIGLLSVIIQIVMLINIISSITRRRKTLKVFLTDAVTQGNNAMYFLYNGGDMIHKRRNYGVRYAIVNLRFVNYRTFTVCHSVAEGDKAVQDIYNYISSALDKKKEVCTHNGDAVFSLILRFTDQMTLEQRLKTLIDGLSRIDSDHIFAFHAGIAVIEPDGTVSKDGQPIRRKDADHETEYAHACTACDTLSGSDDSGVAFFDDKLVENQRWIDTVQEHQRSAAENEEFVVYYQPKYDPRTDELRGAEALIRWQSPEFGFVPPGRIIPIFEKNGFITEIDHYMISHVARDQKMWLDQGYNCVPVSVNVSRAHFIESDLAEQIREMVDAAGCPHDLIEIELTESAFFDDKKALLNTITKLKSYGFAVSMDDFGAGYSSLNSLKDMPLDVLKLDAEFFRGDNTGGRGEIVVSEAIRLAKCLNMRTVAEGVEVRDQVDFLAAQGCDMIQGYYYAKPMPKSDFEERVKAGKK